MLLPYSWLKDYVDVDVTPEELQAKLFSCGFEVEELTYLGKDVVNVVTGRITKTEKHPDADRLTICQVDCGALGGRQIVTAATNVFEGAVVPVALDNSTVLHEGGVQKIKTGKLRGVVSEGMFCSGEELGISDDFYEGAEVNGILILDGDTPLGADIRPVVGIDDWIFDIAVTANRPDCQSVFGMAREVAAILKKPLRTPATDYTARPTDVRITVEVREPALCPRYVGNYVADVKIGTSPRWMRRRLALCGLRSVSDVVDITNFVLLELGQPMHAFDRNYLEGDGVVVRRAAQGETITTLDEKQFTLTPENLLICDRKKGVALAGIMGGLNSEIKADTKEVFFEAAKFARDCVRRTSRALGQRSDSSARFEKGVDAYTCAFAMDRALHLVEQLGCGVPTACRADVNAEDMTPGIIRASYAQIDAVLGIEVPHADMAAILTRLGFGVTQTEGGMSVTVPLWREDVDGYPDLAEEIIRSYGYEHIAPTFLARAAVTRGGLSPAQKTEEKCKRVLQREGYMETCSYSFYSPKDFDLLRLPADAPERRAIRILNPIGEDLSVMRTVLAPSMIANIVRNVRRGNDEGRLFELANVYLAKELPLTELPEERRHVSLGLWGSGDFFDLKGAVEAIGEAFDVRLSFARTQKPFLHPGVAAEVMLGEKQVGWLGELHPAVAEELALEKRVFLGELDYAALSKKFAADITYRAVPKFPDAVRDLAVVVAEETTCAQLEECIVKSCKAAKKAELFDVFRGPALGAGKKSMAFHVTFAAEGDKPVTPELADGYFRRIVESLHKHLGAELR
ncbi:MAG TPA: phenylalanine--tRNA ligase subunit beta [Firmicutes bacterium]|nr:phenylalanine--tRNA ligase subunit beta [Bacillota bacterium]